MAQTTSKEKNSSFGGRKKGKAQKKDRPLLRGRRPSNCPYLLFDAQRKKKQIPPL
jgi:hypothetical protein